MAADCLGWHPLRTARIVNHAYCKGMSLRDAALALGEVSAEDFDRCVRAAQMLGTAR